MTPKPQKHEMDGKSGPTLASLIHFRIRRLPNESDLALLRVQDAEEHLDRANSFANLALLERSEHSQLSKSVLELAQLVSRATRELNLASLATSDARASSADLEGQLAVNEATKVGIESSLLQLNDIVAKATDPKWPKYAGALAELGKVPLMKKENEGDRREVRSSELGSGVKTVDDWMQIGARKLYANETAKAVHEYQIRRESLTIELARVNEQRRSLLRLRDATSERIAKLVDIELESEQSLASLRSCFTAGGIANDLQLRADSVAERFENTCSLLYARALATHRGMSHIYGSAIRIPELPVFDEGSSLDKLILWLKSVTDSLLQMSRRMQESVILLPLQRDGTNYKGNLDANVIIRHLAQLPLFLVLRGVSVTSSDERLENAGALIPPIQSPVLTPLPRIPVARVQSWPGQYPPVIYGVRALFNANPTGQWAFATSQSLSAPCLHLHVAFVFASGGNA